MDLKKINADTVELSMTVEQLRYFRASKGDAFASLGARDFPLRIGVPIEKARDIAQELVAQMDAAGNAM